jgi:hypothetical protein
VCACVLARDIDRGGSRRAGQRAQRQRMAAAKRQESNSVDDDIDGQDKIIVFHRSLDAMAAGVVSALRGVGRRSM